MKGWLTQQYRDIRGHLKFEMLRQVVAILSGATMIGLLYAFWQRIKQVPIDLYLLGGLFIVSASIFFYFGSRLRGVQAVQEKKPPKEEPPKAVLPLALTPPPVDPKKPNLKCEIQDILFYVERLFIGNDVYVLLQVRVVNYGEQEVAVTEWSLEAQAGVGILRGEVEPIPENWKIRRFAPGKVITVEEIGKKLYASTEPFRKGIPQAGWISFKLSTLFRMYPPYNAKFTLKAKDALGEEHLTVQQASFLNESGEIFVTAD